MHMEKAHRFGVAASVFLLGLTGACSVWAQENQGFYVSAFGGVQEREKSGESAQTYTKFDNGWHFSLAGGYRYDNFRVEGEYNGFENDNRTVASEPTGPLPGSGSVSGKSYMLNAYYDIPLENSPLRPYVGLGVGVYETKLRSLTNEGLANVPPEFGGPFIFNGTSDRPFAYQIKLGASYRVNPNLDLAFGYRYFRGDALLFEGTQIGDLTPSGAKLHVLEAGLRYSF